MENPCRQCTQPTRHPGCHGHCKKLQSYYDSDDYKKLCDYKNKYLKSNSRINSVIVDREMRHAKSRGQSLQRFRGIKNN